MSKFRSHVRHNVIGYLALFFALTGVAYAAGPLKSGDPAGGDLSGTYPNPSIAQNAVDSGKVSNGSLTDADISAANKDGTAATPSLRTLGTGAQQAVSGADARLSDARTPTGAAGGDLAGSYPNPQIASGAVGTEKISSTIPAARVTAGTQTTTNGSVVINWPSEAYDTADLHSGSSNTSRLTAPVAGIYRISANVSWQNNFDPNGGRDIALLENNLGEPEIVADASTGGAFQAQVLSTDLKLAAGDYVEVQADENSGSELNVLPRSFTMSWVAPG